MSWTVEGDTIAVELKGRVEPGTYLGFGLSGLDSRTSMFGADVVIAWIDKDTNVAMAEDYFLSQYGQVKDGLILQTTDKQCVKFCIRKILPVFIPISAQGT